MPDADRLVHPLQPRDIQRLLQGIFTDAGAPTELAIEAFAVTAAALYGWCKPGDIELAISLVSMAPLCIHGNPWKTCTECVTNRIHASA